MTGDPGIVIAGAGPVGLALAIGLAHQDLVDTGDTLRREWSPRPGTAVLVRPDAHVGWMAERPSGDPLTIGVTRAPGYD